MESLTARRTLVGLFWLYHRHLLKYCLFKKVIKA